MIPTLFPKLQISVNPSRQRVSFRCRKGYYGVIPHHNAMLSDPREMWCVVCLGRLLPALRVEIGLYTQSTSKLKLKGSYHWYWKHGSSFTWLTCPRAQNGVFLRKLHNLSLHEYIPLPEWNQQHIKYVTDESRDASGMKWNVLSAAGRACIPW